MDKRTICLLNDSFPPEIDGVANAVVNYAKNITKSGENAIVVTPTMPGADDSAFPFPVLRYPSIDTRKKLGYVAGYPFSPETARVLTEQKVDLMHTHCPITSCLLARSLRAVVDAPLVLTYHTKYDVDIAKAVRGKLLQESAIRALVQNIASCDEVWVVSRGAGENLRSLGYEGDYIVMENGVDVPRGRVSDEAIAAATGRYDLPQNVPVFLFVGRLMWYKGIRIILDALKTLREKNVDFRMVFVGEGADGAEIRSYAEERKLSDRCFFTGAISDREIIRAWYGRSDLFLFPSTFDTNGLVVREAAASGTATVMIRNSCASEGVGDGRNGFLHRGKRRGDGGKARRALPRAGGDASGRRKRPARAVRFMGGGGAARHGTLRGRHRQLPQRKISEARALRRRVFQNAGRADEGLCQRERAERGDRRGAAH